MTAKANILQSSDLRDQTRVVQALVLFLKHVNAGTLSVVMMLALAFLDAMRGTDSAATNPAVEKALMAGRPSDVSSVCHGTSNGTERSEIYLRPADSPKFCPSFWLL